MTLFSFGHFWPLSATFGHFWPLLAGRPAKTPFGRLFSNPVTYEDIGSFRGELLERLQEKREGLWKKWETEVSKLEGGWRPWRWWPGRPYARSVGLGAHCPAHRRLGLSKAVRSRWAGYLNTTDSQHWQHCSGVSHNYYYWSWCNEKWVVMWCRPD